MVNLQIRPSWWADTSPETNNNNFTLIWNGHRRLFDTDTTRLPTATQENMSSAVLPQKKCKSRRFFNTETTHIRYFNTDTSFDGITENRESQQYFNKKMIFGRYINPERTWVSTVFQHRRDTSSDGNTWPSPEGFTSLYPWYSYYSDVDAIHFLICSTA